MIPIALPPLRARRTDIPLLVEHFLAKHGEPGRVRKIAPEALEALVALLAGPATSGSSSRWSRGRCSSPTAT